MVVGGILFLHTPDGLGRSELAAQLARASGPLAATGATTMRNWATVTKLPALTGHRTRHLTVYGPVVTGW